METKQQKVPIGVGAIHNPPRANYSEETRNLIKVLMEESKLSMMQRKSIQHAIDKGEPLPPVRPQISTKEQFKQPQTSSPSTWKKRSQDIIVKSGAYEREQFRRTVPLLDKDKQKRHLAYMMAYGQDMPPTPHGPKILHRARKLATLPADTDPADDLVKAIQERVEFLSEMESLGYGKKYRPIIHQEIAQKIQLLETIDKQKCVELDELVDRFKLDRPTPKPFPMGELE